MLQLPLALNAQAAAVACPASDAKAVLLAGLVKYVSHRCCPHLLLGLFRDRHAAAEPTASPAEAAAAVVNGWAYWTAGSCGNQGRLINQATKQTR